MNRTGHTLRSCPGRALTLIELLVAVAMLGILTAMALPNFLEAQTRSKVAAARNNIRIVIGALEVYAVDYSVYPPTAPRFPHDQLALFSNFQLQKLTGAEGYLSADALRDPFADVREITYFGDGSGTPAPTGINPGRALLYYNYIQLAERWNMPCISTRGAAIVSLGPDRQDSLGAYRPFDAPCFSQMYPVYTPGYSPQHHPINTEYDPTNGTISAGDLTGFAGQARQGVR